MKKIFIVILLSQFFVFSDQALACSFSLGYGIGEPYTEFIEPSGAYPKTPKIKEINIQRGYDDGNYASCSDAGILTIVLDVPSDIAIKSYELKIIKGTFPDVIIPKAFITPTNLGDNKIGFRFVWLDMPAGPKQLEALDATLEIRQLTFGNRLSKATIVKLINSGNQD